MASEERYGGIRNDYYVPDNRLTLDLLTSAARRKLGLIEQLNADRVQSIKDQYAAVPKAIETFMEARRRRDETEEAQQRLKMNAALQAQREQEWLRANEKARMEAEILSRPVAEEGGKSLQELAIEAEARGKISAPQYAAAEEARRQAAHPVELQASKAGTAATYAGIEQGKTALEQLKEDRLLGKATAEFDAIYSSAKTPEEKQAAADSVRERYIKENKTVPPGLFATAQNKAFSDVGARRGQAATAAQQFKQADVRYGEVQQGVQELKGKLAQVKELKNLRDQFEKGNYVVAESDVAKAARGKFANTMAKMGEEGHAKNVSGMGISAVKTRMNDAINDQVNKMQEQVDMLINSNPAYAHEPEVIALQNQIAALKSGGQNAANLSRTAAPQPGQMVPVGYAPPIPGAAPPGGPAPMIGGGAPDPLGLEATKTSRPTPASGVRP